MSKENPKSSWKHVSGSEYQKHVVITSNDSITQSEEIDDRVIYIEDLEKRRRVYGTCGECGEPGVGEYWCQPCNAKRFEENFKNWTSGNKDIDELIQHSQLNALHYYKCLEWIPYEKFQNVKYIAEGGFGKIYSADWPEGCLYYWNIKDKEWVRGSNEKVALKSLNNSSSDISTEFLNEIKSHLSVYLYDIIRCYGITQYPKNKNYMMVLQYCRNGSLRDFYSKNSEDCKSKIYYLLSIAKGLLAIHNAGKVHKDFHSGNILFENCVYISDLGMCQPADKETARKEGIFGVLSYLAPEVLRGHLYTTASDIYSFGVVMNEYLSEEVPFRDMPHEHVLAINICKGLRPKISEDTPKLLAGLINRCWDANAKNRPIAKELCQILSKWSDIEVNDRNSEIYSQIKECEKIREYNKNQPKNIQAHSKAIYTSTNLNFKDLPEPVNSSNIYSDISFSSASANPSISEFIDYQISDSDLQNSGNNSGNNSE